MHGKKAFLPRTAETIPEIDRAYAAGILDGEGCVHVAKNNAKRLRKPYHQLRVMVSMTDQSPVIWLAERFGGSVYTKVHTAPTKAHWRPLHMWTLVGRQAHAFLEKVLPYLKVKRQQAVLGLELQSLAGHRSRPITEEQFARREDIRRAVSDLNYSRVKVA